jgi:hypothetical protein
VTIRITPGFTSNVTGKKVFDWEIFVAGRDKAIPIEVKAYNDNTNIWFKAKGPFLECEFEGTDINALRQSIVRYLESQFAQLTDTDWEDWLEVRVSGENTEFDGRRSALGSTLKIEVKRIKRGVVRKTGEVVTLGYNGGLVSFPSPKTIGQAAKTISGYITESDAEVSYIPATDHNLAAIRNILGKMEDLREGIAKLLTQDDIENNLTTRADQLLLAPKVP